MVYSKLILKKKYTFLKQKTTISLPIKSQPIKSKKEWNPFGFHSHILD